MGVRALTDRERLKHLYLPLEYKSGNRVGVGPLIEAGEEQSNHTDTPSTEDFTTNQAGRSPTGLNLPFLKGDDSIPGGLHRKDTQYHHGASQHRQHLGEEPYHI